MTPFSRVMDGHSGLVPPVPISNTEVKQADVSGGTVLGTGDRIRCPLYHSFISKFIKNI